MIRFDRRTFLSGSGGLLLATAFAPAQALAQSGEWRFTDDRGVEIALPRAPLRIAASYPVLTTLWPYGIHPIGLIAHREPEALPGLEQASVDMADVEVLKNAVDGWNFEAVLAAEPDLILTHVTRDGVMWGIGGDTADQERLESIAPILALRGDLPVPQGIERHRDLARALGATSALDTGRADFEQTVAALRQLAAEKPDLSILVAAPGENSVFAMSSGPEFPDLAYLAELGLTIVDGGTQDLSWEQILDYPADIILTDDRSGIPQLDHIATWNRLPAVAAGQVYPIWRYQPPYSYLGYAQAYRPILDALGTARKVTE